MRLYKYLLILNELIWMYIPKKLPCNASSEVFTLNLLKLSKLYIEK